MSEIQGSWAMDRSETNERIEIIGTPLPSFEYAVWVGEQMTMLYGVKPDGSVEIADDLTYEQAHQVLTQLGPILAQAICHP